MTNNDNIISLHDYRLIREMERTDTTTREWRYCDPCGRVSWWRNNLTVLNLPAEEMHCLACLRREHNDQKVSE